MINPVNKPAIFNRSVSSEPSNSANIKTEGVQTIQQPSRDVELGLAFSEIDKLREIIDNTSEIDHNRIQYLKSLIDNGQYEINSDKIANRLTDS